jgi:hypothetical protein
MCFAVCWVVATDHHRPTTDHLTGSLTGGSVYLVDQSDALNHLQSVCDDAKRREETPFTLQRSV